MTFIAKIFAALLLVGLGAVQPAYAQDSVDIPTDLTARIGCLYPLTGPGGLYGRDSSIAIKMAQEFLTQSKSPKYPKLEIKIEDSRSKSLRSLQIARKFIEEDKVDFLCGVVSSGIAMTVTQLAKSHEVFFVGTDHASPSLITEAWHPYYFRVNNGTRLSMLAGAKYIAQNHASDTQALKIAFVGPDYDYGYQAWDDLRFFLNSENVDTEIVAELWPKLFETDC